ncbi:MAG: hypothetical protein KF757_13090 [Phycisphaeraceae bacterium]|nr:hypothetical protein [Phycisphaeraceae bacterium]
MSRLTPRSESPALLRLTDRDEEVLVTLATKVRLMTLDQIVRTWWGRTPASTATRTASRRLLRLVSSGHLATMRRPARSELRLTAPLAVWKPGRPKPAFASLAQVGRSRLRGPVRSTRIYLASPGTARRICGVTTRPPRLGEVTHDLHVATVFLYFRLHRAPEAARWRAEWMPDPARLAGKRRTPTATPDALIERARHPTAIEFVGHYTPDKLLRLHEHCAARHTTYELW